MKKRGYKVQINHYVDKKNGVVVAVARSCEYLAIDEIFKENRKFGFQPDRYLIQDTYRAVARLGAGDEFDEDKGKIIAEKKLRAKLDKIISKKLSLFAADLSAISQDVFDRSLDYRQLVADFENDKVNW